jgi:hypothetical protein
LTQTLTFPQSLGFPGLIGASAEREPLTVVLRLKSWSLLHAQSSSKSAPAASHF